LGDYFLRVSKQQAGAFLKSSSRRTFLTAFTAGAAGLVHGGSTQTAPVAANGGGDGACILTPQAEQGPFYLDPKLVRSDITEGRDGIPLRLRLRLIEAGSCVPVRSARVDVWHCDAQGIYSAYPGQGDDHRIDTSRETFLRGTQATDAGGWVEFETIYPGWYEGRATHIHFKVFLDRKNVLIGQAFLPDALSEFLYSNVPAYGGRSRERAVVNTNDHVVAEADPGRRAFCAVKEEIDRYVATLTLGVDLSADAGVHRLDRPPPGPPPGDNPAGGPALGAHFKDRLAALVPGLRRDK
jgi:protocatechuate 3,4-dioxygenase beta subunit